MPVQVDPAAYQNAFYAHQDFTLRNRLANQQQAQQGIENEHRNRLLDLQEGQFAQQQQRLEFDRSRQQHEDEIKARDRKLQAAQRAAGIARQAIGFTDPAERRAFLQRTIPVYGEDFAALGADINDLPQMLAIPDAELDSGLRQIAGFAQPDMPGSFQEYGLARDDPGYAQFLRERRGKGISITQPDGSVIQIGGEGGAIGPQDLAAPTKNKLQETLVQASDELDRLNSIGNSFDPKFLTIQGRSLGLGLKLKDIGGGLFGKMTPQEQDYLRRYSTFRGDASKNLSMILNRLSGAAISPAEAERLKKGIPNEEDSPTEFHAKYTSAVKDVTRATMRANWALKNGIGVRSVDQLSQVMPLDAIDKVYEQRANQIWQQLGGTQETRAQAVQQANQEFGLAR